MTNQVKIGTKVVFKTTYPGCEGQELVGMVVGIPDLKGYLNAFEVLTEIGMHQFPRTYKFTIL